MKITCILVSFILVCTLYVHAQKCKMYQVNYCEPYGIPFDYSIQSRSFATQSGQTYTLKLVVYKDYEYSVRLCTGRKINQVSFSISEEGGEKQVFYDNSEDNKLEKQFVASRAMPLLIQVTVINDDYKEKEKIDKTDECLGILIEYYRPPKKKDKKKSADKE